MRCTLLYKEVAFEPLVDGLSAYHAGLFHGRCNNSLIDDNNLGEELKNPLRLEKNAYKCSGVFQPERNLVVPESFRERLMSISGIDFFPVVFEKLFFFSYAKGDHSFGPKTYSGFEKWLKSFKNDPLLRDEVESYYELIIPVEERLLEEFPEHKHMEFEGIRSRPASLDLTPEMLQKYPIVWTHEGILFRGDILCLVEDYFDWDYFRKCTVEL